MSTPQPTRDATWPEVAPKPDLPAIERDLLHRWRELDVFARSVDQRADAPVWTFYEGHPPRTVGRAPTTWRPGSSRTSSRATAP
jgi:isoleucyl-tRNA synthetase